MFPNSVYLLHKSRTKPPVTPAAWGLGSLPHRPALLPRGAHCVWTTGWGQRVCGLREEPGCAAAAADNIGLVLSDIPASGEGECGGLQAQPCSSEGPQLCAVEKRGTRGDGGGASGKRLSC